MGKKWNNMRDKVSFRFDFDSKFEPFQTFPDSYDAQIMKLKIIYII